MKKQPELKKLVSFEQLCDLWHTLEDELCPEESDEKDLNAWRLNQAFTKCLVNFSWSVKEWNEAVAKQKERLNKGV